MLSPTGILRNVEKASVNNPIASPHTSSLPCSLPTRIAWGLTRESWGLQQAGDVSEMQWHTLWSATAEHRTTKMALSVCECLLPAQMLGPSNYCSAVVQACHTSHLERDLQLLSDVRALWAQPARFCPNLEELLQMDEWWNTILGRERDNAIVLLLMYEFYLKIF